ncbi:MAG: hypothetical protein ACUVUF_06180 [Candidatus Bathycorpusculaceae bacterium]
MVPEASNKQSKKIEREILMEIRCGSLIIPWCDKVKKVRIIEEE